MITFRCTAKALKRFKFEPADEPPESTNLLGDWYVNLLNLGPRRLVLCTSEHSLLPVILPARNSEFPERFPEYLFRTLDRIGADSRASAGEAVAAREFEVAKTANRSVLGIMNDFRNMALYCPPDMPMLELAAWLAQSPSKPIGYNSPDAETLTLLNRR